MTTVVATRSALYADSHVGAWPTFSTPKLQKVTHEASGEDYLTGMAGYLDQGLFLNALLATHGLKDLWKLHVIKDGIPAFLLDEEFDTSLIIVTKEKRIFMLDQKLVPCEILESSYAIGSGASWALAAMDHGKNPKEAIEYACTRDAGSKAPIHTLTFRTRT
jgi:ATP-dependent protease HslVU (ClpYQ) peptidase subunit